VYQFCAQIDTDLEKGQTHELKGALFLHRGSMTVPSDVPCNKMGKIRTFNEQAVCSKLWEPVERVFATTREAKMSIYYGAVIPPLRYDENGAIPLAPKLYHISRPWNSVFFVSTTPLFNLYVSGKESVREALKPVREEEAYGKIASSINAVASMWAIASLNKNCSRIQLLSYPEAKNGRIAGQVWNADAEEFVLEYFDDDDFDDDPEPPLEVNNAPPPDVPGKRRAVEVQDDEISS